MRDRSKPKRQSQRSGNGRKWNQPKKHRSRETRQPSKNQQQDSWLDELLDTQMVLVGGAK